MALSNIDNNHLLSESETTRLTNNPPSVPADNNHGIDWIGFGFDVNPNLGDYLSSLWTINKAGNHPEPDIVYTNLWMNLPIGKTVAKVNLKTDTLRCYVHFNPSTALYGKTSQLAPYKACVRLVSTLLDALQPFVHAQFDLVDDFGNITRANLWERSVGLTRLDCARNVYISDTFQAKKCLQLQQPKNMKTKLTYENGKNGWGLVNKTQAEGEDKIYDKEEELRSNGGVIPTPDPRGTLFRFETQLMRTRLKKYGFRTLADINETYAWEALQGRWEACRWGVQFSEPGTLAKAISGLSFTQQCGVVEYLAMHSLGLGDGFTASRHRHMGALIRRIGLKLGEPLCEQGAGLARLDLFSAGVIDVRVD
jgi:hypothetical protein